ncbi:MAG: flagellar biosynthetic protein FliO [Sporichthyaceae bacterium]
MTDNVALVLRVGFSFTLVLGLMWVAARVLRSKVAGRHGDGVEVIARAQLGRGASVAVLRVADHALVLGVTERGIVQLGEPITDLTVFQHAATTGTELAAVPAAALAPRRSSKLDGSILSPATWRAPINVLRERTVRRG